LTIRVTERGRDLLLALLASSKPLTQKQLLVALGRGWTLPDVDLELWYLAWRGFVEPAARGGYALEPFFADVLKWRNSKLAKGDSG
jgi:hypothetical protein